ncbi:hypothetical protein M3Y95_00889100 [Aphelenchoides besseyi]|nr:hypothetical protein M3Y95_00889100 [Aphelenchoides besseyi]
MRAFGFQVLLISTFVVLTVLLFFNESSLAYVLINGGGNYKVVVNKSELFLKVQCRHLSYEDFEEEQVTMDVGGCVLELLIKPAEKLPTTQIKSYNDIAPQTPLFVGEQLKFTKQHMLNIHDLPPSSLEFGCATKFERDGETYIVDIKVDGKFPRDYLLYSNNSIVYEESKEEAVDTSTIVFSIVGGLLGIAVVALFGYFIYLCCWRERRENNQTVRQPTVTQQTDKVQESQQNTEQLNNAKKGKQLGDYKNRVIALEEQYNNPGSKQSDVHVKK